MRNGFKSSRGAMRGTIGGAPICLSGPVGFTTVAIGFGPFLYASSLDFSFYHKLKAFNHPEVEIRATALCYPFAAIRCVLFTYLSRHAVEQKCTNSPLSRSGTASTSATCIPQTESRTNRRAATPLCESPGAAPTPAPAAELAAACSVCPGIAPRNIHAKPRRKSATLHDTITNQNKNLKMRAKKSNISLRRVYARRKGRSNENTYFQQLRRRKSLFRLAQIGPIYA